MGKQGYRLPPHNLEAERSVLGAVLLNNSSVDEIATILTPADFYRQAHQKLFEAMLELYEKEEPIDLVTLSDLLRKKGELEKIGGATYLSSLVDDFPITANASYYAKVVKEKALLRNLIQVSTEIAEKSYQQTGDVQELLDIAEQAIFKISESRIDSTFVQMSTLMQKSIDRLELLYERKQVISGVPTGFSQLDSMTSGFQPSDLIIIAGRPSMGKTAFALNIAVNASLYHDVPVAIFSLEMSKEQLAIRLLSSEGKIDGYRLRTGKLQYEKEWEKLTNTASRLKNLPIYIDDSPALSVLEIKAKSRRLKNENKLGMIVVDYLQLMKGPPGAERREQEISEISRSLKALAKELEVPVIALSQLNRRVEDRSDRRPQMADLRESGSIEQDADVILFIYRDEYYNKDSQETGIAEINIAKQRNGPTGTIKLAFLKEYTRFEPLAREEEF